MPVSQPDVPEDRRDLGAVLVLLHGADGGFGSVRSAWRVWRHEERLVEAFRADAEEQKRRGASISIFQARRGEPEPAVHEETVRIWRDGDRFREEHDGGRRDGEYAVADGPLWWMWGEQLGARSNQDDLSVGGGVGQELEMMLNPTPLLSSLWFEVTGSSEVAGRATITTRATARPLDPHHGRAMRRYQLGAGADHYLLEVDQQCGVLLAATAIRNGHPFHAITALEIRFDEPIPDQTFVFAPPDGEQVQGMRIDHRRHEITLTQAQQRAPFTVLMPDRVPAEWQVHCSFFEASQRPLAPAQVALSYRSHDGHQSISITQMAAGDRASHHYETMVSDENWQQITRDDATLHVRPAEWGQAQAHLERDGTFGFLVSDNLTADELATIAARLRAAPSTNNI